MASAAYYISEALLTEEQENEFKDLPTLIKNLIETLGQKKQDSAV